MKATDLLAQQHGRLEQTLRDLASEGVHTVLAKRALLQQLGDELTAHMVIEEQLFYPAVAAHDPALFAESLEEHAIASFALARLMRCPPEDPRFHARVIALRDVLSLHMIDEEIQRFSAIEKVVSDEDLELLGESMKVAFDREVRRGFASSLPPRSNAA
jgi:iron-sulfur cluster repair protein YtfE (RIC family)